MSNMIKTCLKPNREGKIYYVTKKESSCMKDEVHMRKYYGEDGTVLHHQIKIPKHIVPELLSTLHEKTNKHPVITKMLQECRTRYCYPGLARKIPAWVTSCPDCIANKNRYGSDSFKNAEQFRIHHGTRRLPRNCHPTKPTIIKRIPTHHNDDH